MKKRVHAAQVVAVLLVGMIIFGTIAIDRVGRNPGTTPTPTPGGEIVDIGDETIPMGSDTKVLVTQTDADINVIPDKYNTGAKGELKKVGIGDVVEGIQLKADGSGTKNVLDFAYSNKTLSGVIVVEGYDFSDYQIATYNETKVDRDIKIIFKNCKFTRFTKGQAASRVYYEFEDCTFMNFNGSQAKFNRCYFGHNFQDGLNPFRDVEVYFSYFSDLNDPYAQGKGLHIDGTQIYGYNSVDVEHIVYDHCRFELPALNYTDESANVNACIMLQLEYSNGRDIKVRDCVLNGGGYSIYAHTKGNTYTLSDVNFDNIKVGCGKAFGTLYPDVSDGVQVANLSATDSLYVGSVWKENGTTHFSVSNDTNQEKNLKIVTDKGEYQFTIPACTLGKDITVSMSFSDFPFDMDIQIPEDCEYAICYDVSSIFDAKQIRFVNWTMSSVYIDVPTSKNADSEVTIIASGNCGKNIAYSLTEDGVLYLTGTGSTDDFHSLKLTPWKEKALESMIQKVVVGNGIERLGNQLFSECPNLFLIEFGNSVKEFGSRTFARCGSLTTIYLPTTLSNLGKDAFSGTFICDVYCTGEQYMLFSQDAAVGSKLQIRKDLIASENSVLSNQIVDVSVKFPTLAPTSTPTPLPTATPSPLPTSTPTPLPTATPSPLPTSTPTPLPTSTPSPLPTATPSPLPTATPSPLPTSIPTPEPTVAPVAAKIISQGNCGKNVSYTLDQDGLLTLRGTGATYDYNTLFHAPWYKDRNKVLAVKVESGVTSLGYYLFWGCNNLSEVVIEEGVQLIDFAAFISCKSLKAISLPQSLTTISRYAFDKVKFDTVIYNGSQAQWNKISIAKNNDNLVKATKIFMK